MKHLKNEVRANGRKFYVSTANTFDRGLETMVFEIKEGQINYMDLHAKLHDSVDDAVKHHENVINDVMSYIH